MPAPARNEKRLAAEDFVAATLTSVGRCPARLEYVELVFSTAEGQWKWCFPRPPAGKPEICGSIALTLGRYGPQARLVKADGLGPSLPSAEALPAILAGANVMIAHGLVRRGSW
ncbi:hypothetical protein [Mycobacterium sp. OAE908]|uniref:hypothetical protein n=1 Tax=Mycobacterium sp. OAE908 TaxID=2817899 RepID=UPI001AEB6DD7